MKLICPNCQKELASTQTNIEQGFAACANCNEYFKIADYLRDDEEIRRIKKPHYSKVLLSESDYELVISIPPDGWSSNQAIGILIFSGVWNLISWSIFLSGDNPGFGISLSLLIGIASIVYLLFVAYGHVKLSINASEVKLQRLLFSFDLSKTRTTANLEKITEHVAYHSNYQPVYGIGFFFKKNETQLVFGSKLKEEERKWLIGELYEMKSKLEAQRKRNVHLQSAR